jgi:TonB family protein
MNPRQARPCHPVGMCLVFGLMLAGPLAAQSRLYVQEPDGNYHAVVKVSRDRPYIMSQGKPVAAKGDRFALKKVEEYLPVFITVLDKEAGTTAVMPLTTVSTVPSLINHEFHFSAKFVSSYPLEEVFLVIELETSNQGRNIVTCEVGSLAAWTPKTVTLDQGLERNLGPGQFIMHLFVGGDEVLSSELSESVRSQLLDRMIARRIAGVQQAGPQPFFGLAPEYPAALRPTGLKGEVVVKMRITPQGTVADPLVESATHPAFGLAALGVVPQWRFLPRVRDGRAVETKISLPMEFDPPETPTAGAGKG